MQKNKGRLILIPSFLSTGNEASFISDFNKAMVENIRHFIVEQVRTARRFLRKSGFEVPFEEVHFYELNKHIENRETLTYLDMAEQGFDTGLISEAGMPCIADPGASIVKMAHERSIQVVPLAGASSIIMALIASGMNGQNFTFHGYLPIEKKARESKIREMEKSCDYDHQTQIFMETPYRNNQLLEVLIKTLHPATLICIAAEISDPEHEFIQTKTAGEWGKRKVDFHKRPAIFLISKETGI